jgi:hypothetical protein
MKEDWQVSHGNDEYFDLIEGIIGRLNMQGRLTSIPQQLIKGDPAPAEDDRSKLC